MNPAEPGTTLDVRIGSALSTITDSGRASRDAIARASVALGDATPDLTMIFFSPHHAAHAEELLVPVLSGAAPGPLVGCTTQAVIGEGREIEAGPSVSVWCASFPDAVIEPFHLEIEETPDGPAIVGFPLLDENTRAVLLLSDPFTFDAQQLLSSLNEEYPGIPVIGGIASGGRTPGQNMLVHNNEVRAFGATGAVISGETSVRTVVSQGCRPIGDPLIVTECDGNVILGLGGRPPVQRLREAVETLPRDDHHLVEHGLQLGIAIDPSVAEPGAGDFLVRAILNANTETGAMVAGDRIELGQTIQFQLRDPEAAAYDLDVLLARQTSPRPAGALLFTCNGRGIGMFGLPDHDAQAIEDSFGTIPVAGMFCSGEIGPVGGKNHLHGYTASIALFG